MTPPQPKPASPAHVLVTICLGEMLTVLGIFAFPALLPSFIGEWSLSNAEAGWISGIYFAGYIASVLVLVSLTDRVDARRVFIAGAALTAFAAAGFALWADGFWSALFLRALAGIGFAGTYMPGFRALVDRYGGPRQRRALAFYTASYSLGVSFSFLMAGGLAETFGWRSVFAATAAAAVLALVLFAAVLRPVAPEPRKGKGAFFDLRPVLRNRAAMSYILAYGAHNWEVVSLNSWLVAFLAFSLSLKPGAGAAAAIAPTTVAMLSNVMAVVAIVAGGELATRFGPRRTTAALMLASAASASVIGFTAGLPYVAVALLVLAYSFPAYADSAPLTTGAALAAGPGLRGATLALHSCIGYSTAAIGPPTVGWILDLTGGEHVSSWGLAFASIGAVVAAGAAILFFAGPKGQKH